MTTLEIPTVEMMISLIRRMPPRERARLLVLMAQDLAAEAEPVAAPVADPWVAWDALRTTIGALPAGSQSLSDQLEEDRCTRQASLEGQSGVYA